MTLPFTDSEIAAAYAAGIKQKDMARFFGCSSQSIGQAIRRARGLSNRSPNQPGFWRAGTKQSIEPRVHRHTGQSAAYDKASFSLGEGPFARSAPEVDVVDTLGLEECDDLLREWGAL